MFRGNNGIESTQSGRPTHLVWAELQFDKPFPIGGIAYFALEMLPNFAYGNTGRAGASAISCSPDGILVCLQFQITDLATLIAKSSIT